MQRYVITRNFTLRSCVSDVALGYLENKSNSQSKAGSLVTENEQTMLRERGRKEACGCQSVSSSKAMRFLIASSPLLSLLLHHLKPLFHHMVKGAATKQKQSNPRGISLGKTCILLVLKKFSQGLKNISQVPSLPVTNRWEQVAGWHLTHSKHLQQDSESCSLCFV